MRKLLAFLLLFIHGSNPQQKASAPLTLTVNPAAQAVGYVCTVGNVCASGWILVGPYPAAAGTNVPIIAWSIYTGNLSPPPGIIGYDVYRSGTSGSTPTDPYVLQNQTLITATTYADTNVNPGQTYYYVVSSVNYNGLSSSYSREIRIAVPAQ